MRSYIDQEILLTYIKFMKSTFYKYKLLIKPLRKLSGFFLKREDLRMNRIGTEYANFTNAFRVYVS